MSMLRRSRRLAVVGLVLAMAPAAASAQTRPGPQRPAGGIEARADALFTRLDADSDGVVTAAELQAAAPATGAGRGGGRGPQLLARADADKDGRLTREELRAGMAAMAAMRRQGGAMGTAPGGPAPGFPDGDED